MTYVVFCLVLSKTRKCSRFTVYTISPGIRNLHQKKEMPSQQQKLPPVTQGVKPQQNDKTPMKSSLVINNSSGVTATTTTTATPSSSSNKKNPTPRERKPLLAKQQPFTSGGSYDNEGSSSANPFSSSSAADPANVRFYQPFQSYILNPTGAVREDARRTHPKGFRFRVMSSPMERNMNSYFRLPTNPPKKQLQEFSQVHKLARKEEKKKMKEIQAAKKLDGFALLQAAGRGEDPAQVHDVSVCGKNFGSVVAEDFAYFSSLKVLDAGDNEGLALSQFSSLPALEELHIHCNMLSKLAHTNDLMLLNTLNVAFNRLTREDFLVIGTSCPALQRLDFSHNSLGTLNRDEDDIGSIFPHLTQLALENNHLTDGTAIFSVLAEIPNLEELNCNNNELEVISLLPPKVNWNAVDQRKKKPRREGDDHNEEEGDEEEDEDDNNNNNQQQTTTTSLSVPFPALGNLGLGNNRISSIEAIAALSRFPSLRRVILWGNPLQRQRRFESDLVCVEFESIGVQALMHEPSKMNRAKVGKFYNRHDCPFFAVEATDGSGLPRRRKKMTVPSGLMNTQFTSNNEFLNSQNPTATTIHQEQQEQSTSSPQSPSSQSNKQNSRPVSGAATNQQQEDTTGPSFFMTEGDPLDSPRHARAHSNPPASSSAQQQHQQQQQHRSNSSLQMYDRESGRARTEVQAAALSSGLLPSAYGQPMRNLSNNKDDGDPVVEGNNSRVGVGNLLSSLDYNHDNTNSRTHQHQHVSASATLRSVVGDLRRALRQPLPPLPL